MGLYARLSPRPDAQYVLGLDRQEADGRKVAGVRGWDVAVVYRDEEASAYDVRVTRQGFEQMLADLEAGAIDGVVAYDLDRFVRQPADLERAIRIYDQRRGLVFATVQGDLNLMSADGRTMARVMVAFANKSSMDTSRRIVRKHVELAEAGRPKGGPRGFGYEPDGITIREPEAALIREASRRVLAGEAPWSIANSWRDRGILSPTGQPYRHKHLARVLRQPRIAGLRVYRGEVVGEAAWPAIIDRETWERVVAVLDARSRPGMAYARSYLLGGFLRCGRCGTRLVAQPCRGRRTYFCMKDKGGCSGIRIDAESVEEVVSAAVLVAVDADTALAHRETDDGGAAAEVMDLEQRQRELAEMFANGDIGRTEWIAARKPLEARLEAAQRRLRQSRIASTRALLLESGNHLGDRWDAMNLDQRRAVLDAVVDRITIAPAVRGRNRFDRDRIDITWRS